MHVNLKQQVQRGLRVREHDIAGGRLQALQGLPPAAMGGLQLAQDLPNHLRSVAGQLTI